MKAFLAALSLISLLLFPAYTQADTIILKSGRQINDSKCRGSGDQIRRKIYGQVIGCSESFIAGVKRALLPKAASRLTVGTHTSFLKNKVPMVLIQGPKTAI
jgi:hypothetical protein